MSALLCLGCDAFIDSDDDPECFVGEYQPGIYKRDVLCESCRDDEGNKRRPPQPPLPKFDGPACVEALACGVRGPCVAPAFCPTDGCQLLGAEP